jgi:hypothetical protein
MLFIATDRQSLSPAKKPVICGFILSKGYSLCLFTLNRHLFPVTFRNNRPIQIRSVNFHPGPAQSVQNHLFRVTVIFETFSKQITPYLGATVLKTATVCYTNSISYAVVKTGFVKEVKFLKTTLRELCL